MTDNCIRHLTHIFLNRTKGHYPQQCVKYFVYILSFPKMSSRFNGTSQIVHLDTSYHLMAICVTDCILVLCGIYLHITNRAYIHEIHHEVLSCLLKQYISRMSFVLLTIFNGSSYQYIQTK